MCYDGKPNSIDGFRNDFETEKWFRSIANDALSKLDESDILLNDFKKITDWRNTVNHAKGGDRKDMKNEFPKVLERFTKRIFP